MILCFFLDDLLLTITHIVFFDMTTPMLPLFIHSPDYVAHFYNDCVYNWVPLSTKLPWMVRVDSCIDVPCVSSRSTIATHIYTRYRSLDLL